MIKHRRQKITLDFNFRIGISKNYISLACLLLYFSLSASRKLAGQRGVKVKLTNPFRCLATAFCLLPRSRPKSESPSASLRRKRSPSRRLAGNNSIDLRATKKYTSSGTGTNILFHVCAGR